MTDILTLIAGSVIGDKGVDGADIAWRELKSRGQQIRGISH